MYITYNEIIVHANEIDPIFYISSIYIYMHIHLSMLGNLITSHWLFDVYLILEEINMCDLSTSFLTEVLMLSVNSKRNLWEWVDDTCLIFLASVSESLQLSLGWHHEHELHVGWVMLCWFINLSMAVSFCHRRALKCCLNLFMDSVTFWRPFY